LKLGAPRQLELDEVKTMVSMPKKNGKEHRQMKMDNVHSNGDIKKVKGSNNECEGIRPRNIEA
jgi:hypothetical protein